MAPVVRLRPAVSEDCRRLWLWRNDETVRRVSFTTSQVPWEDHCRWFESRLQNKNCRILIAENEHHQPVGQVRLDITDCRAVISISLATEFRGAGLGTAIIRTATRHAFRDDRIEAVDAFIRADNLASQAAFRKAGYEQRAESAAPDKSGLHFTAARCGSTRMTTNRRAA